MLDIREIRDHADTVRERLKARGGNHWTLIGEVLACDGRQLARPLECGRSSPDRIGRSPMDCVQPAAAFLRQPAGAGEHTSSRVFQSLHRRRVGPRDRDLQ